MVLREETERSKVITRPSKRLVIAGKMIVNLKNNLSKGSLLALMLLLGCADYDRYVGVESINEGNVSKPVTFNFVPLAGESDVEFFLRYDIEAKLEELPIEVRVTFEDGTYYVETVLLKLKQGDHFVGKKRGGVVDFESGWRKNVRFKNKNEVKITMKPKMPCVDWQGIEYMGVRVTNAIAKEKS